MSLQLRAQLAKGIYDLYTSAYNLTTDSLKKLIDEPTRIFLNNRKYYYSALSFIKMKESLVEQFQKTGEGYGKQIAYLSLACDSLNLASKDIVIYFITA